MSIAMAPGTGVIIRHRESAMGKPSDLIVPPGVFGPERLHVREGFYGTIC